MYFQTINKALGKTLYKVPDDRRYAKRFVCHDSDVKNKYVQYALNMADMATVKARLLGICYNSYKDASYWNVKPTSLYTYRNRKPVLSDKLCNKILRNVKKEFMHAIEELSLDYRILFDSDGKQIKFKDYPLIYKAIGYFDAFPISYFEEDFTAAEMREITKYMKGQIIIVYLKNTHKIKIYRAINMGKYETVTVDATHRGLICATLYFNNKPLEKIHEMITRITSDSKALANISKYL